MVSDHKVLGVRRGMRQIKEAEFSLFHSAKLPRSGWIGSMAPGESNNIDSPHFLREVLSSWNC